MVDQAELVRDVVRGSRGWRDLADAGIAISLSDDSVSVLASTVAPVPVTAEDVAAGWLRHSDDPQSLRQWARFVHGAVSLVELQLDDHILGNRLLENLWEAAFGEPATQEMHDLARRVLLSR